MTEYIRANNIQNVFKSIYITTKHGCISNTSCQPNLFPSLLRDGQQIQLRPWFMF